MLARRSMQTIEIRLPEPDTMADSFAEPLEPALACLA